MRIGMKFSRNMSFECFQRVKQHNVKKKNHENQPTWENKTT